jgi:hypothetical protein
MSKIGKALIIGAVALSAVAPAVARDGGWYRGGWRDDSPRRAVAMCKHVAEREASRRAYGRADVTDIRDVRETRWGYEVRGRITVNSWRDSGHWNRDRWDRYDRRVYDDGSFKCRVENGRIADLDIDGIRGL